MITKTTMTTKEYENLIDEVAKDLLNPDSDGGAWFDSEEEFEDWAGDVFYSVIDAVFEKLGIEIVDEDEAQSKYDVATP